MPPIMILKAWLNVNGLICAWNPPCLTEKENGILFVDLLLHLCDGFQFFRKKGLTYWTYPPIVPSPSDTSSTNGILHLGQYRSLLSVTQALIPLVCWNDQTIWHGGTFPHSKAPFPLGLVIAFVFKFCHFYHLPGIRNVSQQVHSFKSYLRGAILRPLSGVTF